MNPSRKIRLRQIKDAELILVWFFIRGWEPTIERIKANWPALTPIEIARIRQIHNNGRPEQFGDY